MTGELRVGRALLSVSDKRGLVEFARALADLGAEILASGGTRRALLEAGVPSREVSEVTGFPEMLDGRVKTLHPAIHGGILARRDLASHRDALAAAGFAPIDLVAVNLYPFEATVAREGVSREAAIEQIDVGGPAMVRAAAKNQAFVAVVVDPEDYGAVLAELRAGGVEEATRRRLAAKALRATAAYDAAIAAWLAREAGETFPELLVLAGRKVADLRYGENPHQRGTLYRAVLGLEPLAETVREGKGLSYNNLLDLDAARGLVGEFERPGAAVVKHGNPCGCACADRIADALAPAWEGDPVSAFGSVVAVNRPFDRACAEFLAAEGRFVEAILAPAFEADALEAITTKPKWGKSVRLVEAGTGPRPKGAIEVRLVAGGLLAQTADDRLESAEELRVVTKRAPTKEETRSMLFAATVCKHVRSNAIVLARGEAVVGVCAGQASRVDSVRIAVGKAGERARGAALASDAFFPFADGIEEAARAGVTAVLQPGGSVRDAECVAAADRAGIAMVFTGVRHFRH